MLEEYDAHASDSVLERFLKKKWPDFDEDITWTDYKRMWVLPAFDKGILLTDFAKRVLNVISSKARKYILNAVHDITNVAEIIRALDTMHNSAAHARSSRRSAEKELENCKRITDELVSSFSDRILHSLAEANPCASDNDHQACKYFIKGIRCTMLSPLLR